MGIFSKLFTSSKPVFTTDWFTHNLPAWDLHLMPYLSNLSSPRVLEIGAFEGRSSLWFLSINRGLNLTVIDPWDYTAGADLSTYEVFKKNIAKYQNRVKIIKEKSSTGLLKISNQKFDLVYVDGDHSSASVIHDAILAYGVCKKGGLIVFDDYLGGDLSISYPKPAIDFFHAAYTLENKIKLVSEGYQRFIERQSFANDS